MDSRVLQTWELSLWRGTEEGRFASYQVPCRERQTVLDVVTYVQRHIDASVSYRFACRVGMCGSCAMTVNGVPRWTCRTRIAEVAQGNRIAIAPLSHLPVIKDLVCDMSVFFEKWTTAGGAFVPTPGATDNFAHIPPDHAARRAADAAIECIGCGVCYAGCDVVGWRPEYLGPAALNRAWTLVNDARDGAGAERIAAVAGDAGCHACHSQQNCTRHCPKHLNPAASIAGLKRRAAAALWRGGS